MENAVYKMTPFLLSPQCVNSLVPGSCGRKFCNLPTQVLDQVHMDGLVQDCSISSALAMDTAVLHKAIDMSLAKLFSGECQRTKSTLVQVMAWCRQAPSHYLNQCWPCLCRHMASLGHNELTLLMLKMEYSGFRVQYHACWCSCDFICFGQAKSKKRFKMWICFYNL